MTLKPRPPLSMWVVLLLLLFGVALILFNTGCATCEPTIIKEPVEVQVPVPIPPERLIVAPAPVMELCGPESSVQGRVKCIRRNIERWRLYAQELLDEIEAHNAAIPE